jgi:hypothetical protein
MTLSYFDVCRRESVAVVYVIQNLILQALPMILCRVGSFGRIACMKSHKSCNYSCQSLSQISLGVIIAWTKTIAEQFALLAGKSAPHDFLQLIIYKAMTFSKEIESIDTVRAYHVSSIVSS